MQYILSEEEYVKLVDAPKIEKQKSRDTINELCKRVADHEPVKWTWGEDREIPKPWKCIHQDKEDEFNNYYEWYCDQCPVQKLCTMPKEYSK